MTAPVVIAELLPAHKTILSAVDQVRPLQKQLDLAFILIIKRCSEKVNKIWRRSFSLKVMLVILSMATTLFVGFKFQDWQVDWLHVSLLICAIVTGLWVFEIFKDYRSAWLNALALQNSISRLYSEYQLLLDCVTFLEKQSLPAKDSLTLEQVYVQYWNRLQVLLNGTDTAC
ncbi:hypothetical protein [Psychromonas sp.]|uniref:hypothetical protein n=1 Tax=Psychromonas sp. TaxID=1884585 RepID=UPI003566A7D0